MRDRVVFVDSCGFPGNISSPIYLPTHINVNKRKLIIEDFMLKGDILCYFHPGNKDNDSSILPQ